MQTETPDPIRQDTGATRPYAPSFLDRFMDFVERLPIPYWLTYLGLFLLQILVFYALAWILGGLPAYTIDRAVLVFPLWLWGPLAIMTHLGSVSLEALSSFGPLLEVGEKRLEGLKYEFGTMPARGVILSGVIWSVIYFIMTYAAREAYARYGFGPAVTAIVILEGLVSFSIGGAIYYYSLRQLRLVNRTVKMVKQFSLFRLDPVYAFSRLTSQIGVSWMLMLSLTLLLFPVQLGGAPFLAILVVQVVLAMAAFVLPLWFVHRRLVAEKRRLLGELNRRVESTLERLHRHLDESEPGEADQLSNAMSLLSAERDVLASIATWPWRAGTLAGFLSAIVLPIILFLVQFVISNWLGE